MTMTPLDVRQQKFQIRFRGFDVQEVDLFLETIAQEMEALWGQRESLQQEVEVLKGQIAELEDGERSFKLAMVKAQKMMEEMKHNAEKEAQVIIAEAETKAEQILSSADRRLFEVQGDIVELKRQRMQVEVQLRGLLESHARLLDMTKEAMEAEDESEEKLRFLKKT